jgi:hypothetical protein
MGTRKYIPYHFWTLIGHFLFKAERFIVTPKNIRLRVVFKLRELGDIEMKALV